MVKLTLMGAGYDIVEASDGAEGLSGGTTGAASGLPASIST